MKTMDNLENVGNNVESTEFDEFFLVKSRVHANNFGEDFRHLRLGKHATCQHANKSPSDNSQTT